MKININKNNWPKNVKGWIRYINKLEPNIIPEPNNFLLLEKIIENLFLKKKQTPRENNPIKMIEDWEGSVKKNTDLLWEVLPACKKKYITSGAKFSRNAVIPNKSPKNKINR